MRATDTDAPPMMSHAMIGKLVAKVFSMESCGNVNCQWETASVRYGTASEHRKPTIKPTKAAMATAFLCSLAVPYLTEAVSHSIYIYFNVKTAF